MNVQFISVLSERPPTVWLVTAGLEPHILGTQLPCRHVLTHAHIRMHTLPCTRHTGTGKQSIWTASKQKRDHISVVWKKKSAKRHFSNERKEFYVRRDPHVFYRKFVQFKRWWNRFLMTICPQLSGVFLYLCVSPYPPKTSVCFKLWLKERFSLKMKHLV